MVRQVGYEPGGCRIDPHLGHEICFLSSWAQKGLDMLQQLVEQLVRLWDVSYAAKLAYKLTP